MAQGKIDTWEATAYGTDNTERRESDIGASDSLTSAFVTCRYLGMGLLTSEYLTV